MDVAAEGHVTRWDGLTLKCVQLCCLSCDDASIRPRATGPAPVCRQQSFIHSPSNTNHTSNTITMPLHLLGKKSWNVYNPTAIAKVRADEARSAAREEAQNELELTYQADVRLALLRGLPEPPRPAELDIDLEAEYESGKRREPRERAQDGGREEKLRKMKRKRVGEDDTDMELRVAKAEMGERDGGRRSGAGRDDKKGKESLPLVGEDGHIQLFAPVSPSGPAHDARKQDPEEILRKKQQEEREGGAMRFDTAGGNRSNPATTPWYAGSALKVAGTNLPDGQATETIGRDAWGNEDAGRKSRDAVRMSTADPMAMMQMAQRKLKAVESEREEWKREREAEVGVVPKATYSRDHDDRRHERSHRSRDHRDRTEHRHERRHNRSRDRSRERRHRHPRRHSRSRSPEREHHRSHRSTRG